MSGHIAILPTGIWGTTLGVLAAHTGHQVTLWHRREEVLRTIREEGRHPGGIPLPYLGTGVHVEADLAHALRDAGAVILAPASPGYGDLCRAIAPYLPPVPVLSATKGLEAGTYARMSEVYVRETGRPAGSLSVLSGPNFAVEIARGLPASTVIASQDPDLAVFWQRTLSTSWFRAYTGADVLGVELCGALKNVIALSVGIAAGMKLGQNAQAALITRGLAELVRLGRALGAREETFFGLAGVGDLVLTCSSDLSRNRALGVTLARGVRLDEALATGPQTVEGLHTAPAACALAGLHRVELPISREVCAVLFEGKPPHEALRTLMSRELRGEYPF